MENFGQQERIINKPAPVGVREHSAAAARDYLRRRPHGPFWCFVVEREVDGALRQGVIGADRYNRLWKERKWDRLGYRVLAVYVRHPYRPQYEEWVREWLGHTGRTFSYTIPIVRIASRGELRRGEVKERHDDRPRKPVARVKSEVYIP